MSFQHKIKSCGRCSASFECKPADIAHCQCSEIVISDATRRFLEQTEYDCLCKNCLAELNQKLATLAPFSFPNSHELIEGFHYYIDKGLFVFTENYLILRGYCCRNKCRHCPYGFQKD